MLIEKNKKAQAKLILSWITWLMLFIIVAGVSLVVWSHYSKNYDIRDIESELVSEKIFGCFVDKGVLDENQFSKPILENCLTLNEKEIYLDLKFNDQNLNFGDDFLKTLCESQDKGIKIKHYPECLQKKYYVLDSNNNQKTFEIFVGIGKLNKNVA